MPFEAPLGETRDLLKTKDSVADRLATDIQAGRFSAGSWLKQIDLQARYDASRPEVRKALEHLASKRLIRYVPNRGYYVHQEDGAASDEIRDIRIMLETAASEHMTAGATGDQISALRHLAQRYMDLLDSGTILEIYETNLAFHSGLLATTGNGSLVELVSELRLRTSPAPASQWSTRSRIETSGREHFEMIDALEARDAVRLSEIIRRHIRQDAERTI